MNWAHLGAAGLAPLAALALPGGLAAVPVGWVAALAAWRSWGKESSWAASLLAAAGVAAWGVSWLAAALLCGALAVAAFQPRWGALALGVALVGVSTPFAAAAAALGLALAFVPRMPVPRESRPPQALGALVLLAAAALLAMSFLVPRTMPLGTALTLGGAVALAVATGAGAVVAWRAQRPQLLSWSLAPLVVAPLALASLVLPLAGALAAFSAAAAVQAPVVLRLVTRGLGARRLVPQVVLGAVWALALLVRPL